MKIRTKNLEGNKATLEVEVEYSQFETAVQAALIEAGKEVSIPGFRLGKAPKEMVEKVVSRDMLESRAAQNIISEIYPGLVDEAKIDPVDYPNVEVLQLEKDKPLVFKISVDVYPEVKLGKYKGLKVEKKQVAVTDEEIDKVLGNLQDRFSKPGPDGQKELLPLDDEFAKKVSNFGALAELKQEIKTMMIKDQTAEAEADLRNKLIAAASGEAKLDIPPAMVEREIDIMLDELRSSLAQNNLTLEDYLKGIKKEEGQLREELRQSADLRMRGKIVLQEIAKAEKLELTAADIDQEIENIAKTSGQSAADLKQKMSSSFRKYVEEYLLRQKALDFITEQANIKMVAEKASGEEAK